MELMAVFISLCMENIQWIFSGIGVFVLGFLLHKKTKKENHVKQCNNIAGGDIVGGDKKNR